jgi:hypothetical protein
MALDAERELTQWTAGIDVKRPLLIVALVVADLDAILDHASAVATTEFSAELPSEAELKQIAHS